MTTINLAGYDFFTNGKTGRIVLYVQTEEGLAEYPNQIELNREDAERFFQAGLLFFRTKIAKKDSTEVKPLKPDQPIITEE